PGTRGIHAVGGMMIAWSHAVPRPQIALEWDGPLSAQTLSHYLDDAERALWSTDVLDGDGGARQQWVQDRLAQHAGVATQRVPLAARRNGSGRVEYAGAAALFDPGAVTGELTIVTGAVAQRVVHRAGRATSVVVRAQAGGELTFSGAVVVIGAGAVGTPQLLFASGLRHPALGRYATDHVNIVSTIPLLSEAPAGSADEPTMNLYLPVTEQR